LQQVRQLGVAVGNVLLLGAEGVDDVAEAGQRLVNVGGLLKAGGVVNGARLVHTLGTGKVDQVQLAIGLHAS
jgi:hypothetical protein